MPVRLGLPFGYGVHTSLLTLFHKLLIPPTPLKKLRCIHKSYFPWDLGITPLIKGGN